MEFPRLKKKYIDEIAPGLMEKLQYKSVMQVPKIKKIVVNMGVGETVTDSKLINSAIEELSLITGQKPVLTQAKKSIAGFKLRKGLNIGCKVTLRKNRMYEFLDRLINIALPRVRDFRGLSMKSFDGTGNYSLGIKEQIIFPEIDYDNVDKIRGLDITITTSAKNDEETKALLLAFNFPIKQIRAAQNKNTTKLVIDLYEYVDWEKPVQEKTSEGVFLKLKLKRKLQKK